VDYGRATQAGIRQENTAHLGALAGDSLAADHELRRRLREAGHPLGSNGAPGTARRYADAVGLGYLAMDSAPQYHAPADTDAGLRAALRVDRLSPMGRVIHEN